MIYTDENDVKHIVFKHTPITMDVAKLFKFFKYVPLHPCRTHPTSMRFSATGRCCACENMKKAIKRGYMLPPVGHVPPEFDIRTGKTTRR